MKALCVVRLLLAFAAVCVPYLAAASPKRGVEYFTNLEVVTQDGETVRFYDDLIKDKVVVVSFIFTSCTDMCPINTARMTQVADVLGDALGKNVFFVSISVDPENDTPEKMRAFADAFYNGPGWTFVTGSPENLKTISYQLGNREEKRSDHINEIILGNDRTGEWARNTPFNEPERLATIIQEMDPEWRMETVIPPDQFLTLDDLRRYQVSADPGQVLFRKLCSGCHTVGVGDRVGPDLLGISERRDEEWIKRYIRDPAAVRQSNDLAAIELGLRYGGVRMPNLGLSENDATDLITYLNGQADIIARARAEAVAQQDHHAPVQPGNQNDTSDAAGQPHH